MGIQYLETVDKALQDRAPALHRNLKQRGLLDGYVQEVADQISSAVTEGLMRVRREKNLDALPPMEKVQALNTARAGVEEKVLADLLEFQSDAPPTSRPAGTGEPPTPT